MLDELGLMQASGRVMCALEATLASRCRTQDPGGTLSMLGFTREVLAHLIRPE